MSLYGSFLSDDQFQCSICLDVFTNPSSTPCGHSFCMGCITRYWDGSKVCQCPLCKKSFQKRPELQINRTLKEITEQFKSMSGKGTRRASIGGRERKGGGGGGRGWEAGTPAGVLFDELTKKQRGMKTPAVNIPSDSQSQGNPFVTSCSPEPTAATPLLLSSEPNQSPLDAMVQAQSLNHGAGLPPLPPPYPYPGRRRFTVTALDNSANVPVCEVHRRGILVYCRTDRVCICPECKTLDHQDHDTVSVESEWQEQKALLSASEQNTEVMIKLRVQKIEEIRMSVSELEVALERETAGSACVLGAMLRAVERSQAELQEVMEMSRRAAEHQADALIRQLELEVSELRRRGRALAELTQSEDHIHCVKSFPALSAPPPTRDWSGVSVNSDLGTGTVYRSLAVQLERFQQVLKNVAEIGFPVSALESSPVRTEPKLKRIQDYAVDMTLDSNTAHPRLVLSEDMKQVKCGERHQLVLDNPERFDRVVCVLGRNSISSGKHYWEVEVGGKTDWDLGVASQSISRKGKVDVNPCNGYWFLSLRDKNKYAFRTEPSTEVPLSLRPQKIGVFVDYDKGQVSFYNVDAKIHIYTFTDTFTEGIYGFFSPCTNKSGNNDAPLTITPVNMIE